MANYDPLSRGSLPTPSNHKQFGIMGENLALEFLIRKGYRLRHKNYRLKTGEIDLVMDSPGGVLVFVEVKSNRTPNAGAAEGWVNNRKIRQIQRMAKRYCWQFGQEERDMRFDVIGVDMSGYSLPVSLNGADQARINHIENAFLPDGRDYY